MFVSKELASMSIEVGNEFATFCDNFQIMKNVVFWDVKLFPLVISDISERSVSSIIRLTICDPGIALAVTSNRRTLLRNRNVLRRNTLWHSSQRRSVASYC
jgi:hypothetical protein